MSMNIGTLTVTIIVKPIGYRWKVKFIKLISKVLGFDVEFEARHT